jgi:hypothetical protein
MHCALTWAGGATAAAAAACLGQGDDQRVEALAVRGAQQAVPLGLKHLQQQQQQQQPCML